MTHGIMSRPRAWALALSAWLVVATCAHASSPWLYGTIVSAEVDAEGKPHLVLLVMMDNYLRGPEQAVRELRMEPLTTVSLDGAASTFAEACRPGRAATYFQRQTVYGKKGNHLLVSTQAGPSRPAALDDPNCNLVFAALNRAGDLSALLPGAKDKTVAALRRSGVVLVLERHKGEVARGIAWTSKLREAGWHEAQVGGVKLTADGPVGRVGVTYRGADGKTTITATYDLAGKSYNGTCGGEAVKGSVACTGQRTAPPPDAAGARFWLRTEHPALRKRLSSMLTGTVTGEAVADGRVIFRKGMSVGTIKRGMWRVKDGRLTGSLTCASTKAAESPPVNVALAGRVFGGVFVAAALKLDGETAPLRSYGFLVHPNAAPTRIPDAKAMGESTP